MVDDFLANGEAVRALKQIVEQSKASLEGVAIAIEKGFQGGGDALRKDGVDLYSLAIIENMTENDLTFRD